MIVHTDGFFCHSVNIKGRYKNSQWRVSEALEPISNMMSHTQAKLEVKS